MSETRPTNAPDRLGANTSRKSLLWLVLLLIGLAWGLTGPLSKIAVSTGHDAIGVSFWDALISAITLSIVSLARRRRIPIDRRHIAFYLGCAFLGTVLPNILSYTAYQYLPVGVIVMVYSTVPMMTLLIALPMRLEKATPRRVVGLCFGLAAVLMVYLPSTSLPDPSLAILILLPVLGALGYAGENIVISRYRPQALDPIMMICAFSWGAVLMLSPIMLVTDAWFDISVWGPPELAIVGIAVLHVVAYSGFVWLIGNAGPVFASQVGYLVTATGISLGMAIYGERHSIWVWLALCLIFIGLFIVTPRSDQRS